MQAHTREHGQGTPALLKPCETIHVLIVSTPHLVCEGPGLPFGPIRKLGTPLSLDLLNDALSKALSDSCNENFNNMMCTMLDANAALGCMCLGVCMCMADFAEALTDVGAQAWAA